MEEMGALVRVREVKPIDRYDCLVIFENGTQKQINLQPFLKGPIFDAIRNDPAVFRSVHVVDGIIGWDDGADIDPDVLYYGLTPSWMDERLPE